MPAAPMYSMPASMPVMVPSQKSGGYYGGHGDSRTHGLSSLSPPELSSSAGSSSAGPSYAASSMSSARGGTSGHASPAYHHHRDSVDRAQMLNERLSSRLDTSGLDRSMARQAQTSGALNAKQRDLAALQAEAQRRLANSRASFAEGISAAKDVKRDLEWTQRKMDSMKGKAERQYPTQYARASNKYPVPLE